MVFSAEAVDPFLGLTIASETQPNVELRIERRLGEGGTAVAYFATRFGPDGTSPVVVKVIWLAIEYVHGGAEGATLEERVKHCVKATGFAFGAERALRVLRHVSEGLREIHEVGVIHRDINPNNVLCCGSGASEIFKISDFGIARPLGLQHTFGNATVLECRSSRAQA